MTATPRCTCGTDPHHPGCPLFGYPDPWSPGGRFVDDGLEPVEDDD